MSFIFTKENVTEYPQGLLHPHDVLNGRVPIGTKYVYAGIVSKEAEIQCPVCDGDISFKINIKGFDYSCPKCNGNGYIGTETITVRYDDMTFLGCKLYMMGSSGLAIAYRSRFFEWSLVDKFNNDNGCSVYYFTAFQNREYAEKYMKEVLSGNANKYLMQAITAGCFHGEFE